MRLRFIEYATLSVEWSSLLCVSFFKEKDRSELDYLYVFIINRNQKLFNFKKKRVATNKPKFGKKLEG